MQLTEFIQRSLILGPEIRTLEQAIAVMLNGLAEKQLATELIPEILAAVLRRENLSSTAIGRGMAIPHAGRLPIERVMSIVAVTQYGVEGHSIDGELVYVIFLLLLPIPPSMSSGYRLHRPETEALWRFLRNEELYAQLRQSRSEEEINQVIALSDQSYSFLGTV